MSSFTSTRESVDRAEELQSLRESLDAEGWLLKCKNLLFEKELGRGSSGVTYAGKYEGQDVAIKVYSRQILNRGFECVRRELEIMSRVRHQNVIEVIGICITDADNSEVEVSLVTKLATRGDLSQVLYSRRRLRSTDDLSRCNIALGLAKGLQYLSKIGVVHRDLKPANILLNVDGEPLIMDFGFSRWMDSLQCMTGETGSYRYMAPEMIRSQQYDEKVDTYSFGVLLNEISVKRRPYQNVMPVQAAIGVANKGLRPSQKGIKSLRLKSLIQKCWAQNSEDRPDWDTIVKELEVIRNETCSARNIRKVSAMVGKNFFRVALTKA